MADITNTTQLTVFSLIRTAIIGDSVLASKFPLNSFYIFEPNFKNKDTQFPYIVIPVPQTATDLLTLSHDGTIKNLQIPMILVMEYVAKDNFVTYCNKIIYQLEHNESTFDAAGYMNVRCEFIDSSDEIRQEKPIITGLFNVIFDGGVNR